MSYVIYSIPILWRLCTSGIRHQQLPYVYFDQPQPQTSHLQLWSVLPWLCHSISLCEGLTLCSRENTIHFTVCKATKLMAGMQHRMQHTTDTEYCTSYLHLCDCSAPQVRDGTAVYTGRPPVHCCPATSQGGGLLTPAEAVTIAICVGGGTVLQGWMNGLQCTTYTNRIIYRVSKKNVI